MRKISFFLSISSLFLLYNQAFAAKEIETKIVYTGDFLFWFIGVCLVTVIAIAITTVTVINNHEYKRDLKKSDNEVIERQEEINDLKETNENLHRQIYQERIEDERARKKAIDEVIEATKNLLDESKQGTQARIDTLQSTINEVLRHKMSETSVVKKNGNSKREIEEVRLLARDLFSMQILVADPDLKEAFKQTKSKLYKILENAGINFEMAKNSVALLISWHDFWHNLKWQKTEEKLFEKGSIPEKISLFTKMDSDYNGDWLNIYPNDSDGNNIFKELGKAVSKRLSLILETEMENSHEQLRIWRCELNEIVKQLEKLRNRHPAIASEPSGSIKIEDLDQLQDLYQDLCHKAEQMQLRIFKLEQSSCRTIFFGVKRHKHDLVAVCTNPASGKFSGSTVKDLFEFYGYNTDTVSYELNGSAKRSARMNEDKDEVPFDLNQKIEDHDRITILKAEFDKKYQHEKPGKNQEEDDFELNIDAP